MSAVALHCEQDGPPDGPALLLGSSLGTTTAMWEPALATLAARHRVVRFDHRGHGRSPAPPGPYEIADLGADVLALLDRLGLARVHYAGVSLGGMVGLWLAANAPERIVALVCICSSAHLPPAQGWTDRAASVRKGGSVAVVADAVLARWFTPDWAAAHPDIVDRVGAMLRDSSPAGYAACCEAIARLDLRPDLARITPPTLAIGAADDTSTPPEHARAIAAGIAGARVEVLTHGAHLAPIECADEVCALIEGHLESASQ